MHGSLATRLRVLRAERGLTVRQVAELSGVAKETISQVERGERHPYDRTLAKLAHAYGVPVEELLKEPALALGKAKAPTTGRPETQYIAPPPGTEYEYGPPPTLHRLVAFINKELERGVSRDELAQTLEAGREWLLAS
jgi:transcriptional regulator with XRE-family HTH domain